MRTAMETMLAKEIARARSEEGSPRVESGMTSTLDKM